MRISYWSSDGCSSDLFEHLELAFDKITFGLRSRFPLGHIVEVMLKVDLALHVEQVAGSTIVHDMVGHHASHLDRTPAGGVVARGGQLDPRVAADRKSTRLNSSH